MRVRIHFGGFLRTIGKLLLASMGALAFANAPQKPAWNTWVRYGETAGDHANYAKLKSDLSANFQRFAMGNAQQWWLVAGTYTYRNTQGKTEFLKFRNLTANDTQVPLNKDLMQVAFVEDTGQEAPRREGLLLLIDYHWFYLRAKDKPADWASLVREFTDSREGKPTRNLLVDELEFSKNTLVGRGADFGEFRFISPYN